MNYIPDTIWYNVLYNGILEGFAFGFTPLLIVFVLAFLISIIFTRHRFHAFLIGGFAIIGCYLGMSIGGSRESITGAVLPAIITLLSGFIAYYFKSETDIFNRRLVPGCIVSLVTACSFGQSFYGELRATAENYKVNVDLLTENEKSKIRANEEFSKSVTNRINLFLVCQKTVPGEKEMCKQAFLK
jgi:hypothetical protein